MAAPQPSAPSCPNPNSNPNRPNTTLTSTWTIQRNSGCAGLPFTKPYGGDATTLVRYLQDAIRATSQGRSPPIDLLGGRWSWNQPNNFVLIFAGQPSIEQVQKYCKVILKPFDDSFQLIPSRGFTRLLVHGMPCSRCPDGSLPSSADILKELAANVTFQGATIIDGPTWCRAVVTDPSKEKGAVSFILIDDTNTKATNMCRGQIWAYGVQVTVRHGIPSYPFRQCGHCHELSHSTETCS